MSADPCNAQVEAAAQALYETFDVLALEFGLSLHPWSSVHPDSLTHARWTAMATTALTAAAGVEEALRAA